MATMIETADLTHLSNLGDITNPSSSGSDGADLFVLPKCVDAKEVIVPTEGNRIESCI